ncbi:hypothetical protein HPP92_001123 [Vanilla planifolia]|uniref:RING-type domain-containing protein n=1 Tax=Vanilla planifolia TaxID=51239 RepID=A0A835VF23_VANPL|nr:hypothetical protein HPP92_001123 [Vanilla planifolia]
MIPTTERSCSRPSSACPSSSFSSSSSTRTAAGSSAEAATAQRPLPPRQTKLVSTIGGGARQSVRGVWARDDGCHGLDAKVVAALPEFVNGEKGKVVDCVVCLSAMQEGEKGRLLPRCGHGFHAPCIDAWLRWHSTCPICRAAVQGEATVEEVVVVVEGGDLVGGSVVVQETEARGGACHGIQIDAKEEAAAASAAVAAAATPMSSSSSSSVVSSSLKRMLSKSRSEKRVSPSAIGN